MLVTAQAKQHIDMNSARTMPAYRAHEIAEHHGDLAPFGGVFARPVDRGKHLGRGRPRIRISAQGGDGVQQLTTVPNESDTEIFQVLRRQPRQDRVIDRVLAEGPVRIVRGPGSEANLRRP